VHSGRGWTLRLAEGHAAALDRVVDPLDEVGLAGQDDLARWTSSEGVALASPDIGALRLQDELEFLFVDVVARDIEGVARDELACGLVRKTRDPEWLVDARQPPGEHVQCRETADALLALVADTGRAHRGPGELREREESLAVDRVERTIRVGGRDANAPDDLAAEHHRRGHRGMQTGLAQELRIPDHLAPRLDGVVADADDLAAPDHLRHERPHLLRRRAGHRRTES
jgi:hypothetical protein